MEEIKNSVVQHVTGNGVWDSPNGKLYRFEVTMQNGDCGEYLSKTQTCEKFKIGETAHYSLSCKVYNDKEFWKIKPAQDPNQAKKFGNGGGGRQYDPETDKRITRMSVLKVAGDLVINGAIPLSELISHAQLLEEYVMTGKDTFEVMRNAELNNRKEIPF